MSSQAAGIDHCLALISSLEDLVIDAIGVLKGGHLGLTAIYSGLKALSDIYHVLKEAALVWPELAHLDAEESGKLAEGAYNAFRNIAQAVVK